MHRALVGVTIWTLELLIPDFRAHLRLYINPPLPRSFSILTSRFLLESVNSQGKKKR